MSNIKLLKSLAVILVLAAFILAAAPLTVLAAGDNDLGLYPPRKPYKTGYLQVSKLHRIFYQLGGNPTGKPVMVLHGGPGSGCFPGYFRYFNPMAFKIILHDQRGALKSTPFGEIKENTTWHLVEDIEKLRRHLGLEKVIIWGGSWGSTLALAYAETYPQNVSAIVMRGIFTATQKEIDHFYHGGSGAFFPKAFQKLVDLLGDPAKKNFPSLLLKKLQSPDPEVRKKYALAWAVYESKLAFLEIPDKDIHRLFRGWDPYAFSLIENYYMANKCFLKEGQLLDNAHKLKDIPLTMVNGRYDVICPPSTAYKLHKLLPKSKLVIAEKAGHTTADAPVSRALVNAMKEFE
jgi:proline iminopeptidase